MTLNAETNSQCPEDPRAVGEARFEALEEGEDRKGDRGVQPGTVEDIGNEVGEFDFLELDDDSGYESAGMKMSWWV